MSLYNDIDILSTRELLALPPIEYLVDGLIPKEGFAAIYGAPASAKSFISLDWAMSISEGKPWLGRVAVKQSPVVYIAAEGGRGIKKRVEAWMQHYGVLDLDAMYWLLSPLYVREDGKVEEFLDKLEERDIWPGLIVLDTLSRSFGGGEENASADMGDFVDRITQLAYGRRMASLVVHHKNAQGARERGSTAFRGAADAMFDCTATRNPEGRITLVELRNDKQKDDEELAPIYLRPLQVATSIVLEETEAPEKVKKGDTGPKPMRTVDMLAVLGADAEGMTWKEWRLGCGVERDLFNRRIKKLKADGHIYKEGDRYCVYPSNADVAGAGEDDDE